MLSLHSETDCREWAFEAEYKEPLVWTQSKHSIFHFKKWNKNI